MKKNTKLTVLLILCVALLVGFGAIKLLYPKYREMSKQADANEKVAKDANDKLTMAKGLNANSINRRLNVLKARVPNSLELPNVILRINQKSDEAGLSWLEGTPEDVTALSNATPTAADASSTVAPISPQLDIHQVTIKVRGDVNNLIKFYSMLSDKTIGRIVVVTGSKITPVLADNQTSSNVVDAEITLNIYGWIEGSNIDISGCEKDTSQAKPDCSVTQS